MVRARGFGAALRKACLGISTVALLATSGACAVAQRGAPTTKTHVMALASDESAGRATGSVGERRAAAYIVSQLRRFGVVPLPGSDDHRLAFEFSAGARDGGSSIGVSPADGPMQSFSARADVQALSFSEEGTLSAPLVFAGYGIVVPSNQEVTYDSYAGLDVKDKIVVVLRYFPESSDPKVRSTLARYSALRFKATAARQRGAKALLVVTGPRSSNAGEVVPMTADTAIAGSGIVALSIGANAARAIFSSTPRPLEEAQRALDSGDPGAAGFDLPRVAATVKASVSREKRSATNIVGYLPATSGLLAPDKPWVALGAHYDHLGRGEIGNSLAGKDEARAVHYGADDNASGVAAVLAIAEALASRPRHRHVLIAFWSGEEIGLLGSSAFIRAAPVPIDRLAAYLNFDMVGRMQQNRLIVQATGTSPVWLQLLKEANAAAGFDLALQADPYQPTDIASFNEAGVPGLNFFTGAHADYHRPSDTAEKINYTDLERVAAFGTAIVRRIASLDRAPAFVKVEQTFTTRPSRAGVRVFTGTIPEYGTEVNGLQVGGVIGGGPADKAGLRKGDVIVEIAGQAIANIYDYTYAIGSLKAGAPVKVIYLRNGERRETTLTPAMRNE
ncbi:MAG: M20/M25/M40 family metallo-hydrolase [Burkholderiales bacterium]